VQRAIALIKLSLAVLPGSTNVCFDEEAFLPGYDFTNRVRGALIKAREEAHRRHHEAR